MSDEAQDLTGLFRQEANAILEAAPGGLLELERDPGSAEARHESLRRFHTLKGMANMEGHPDLARACHEAETLLLQEDPPIDVLLRQVDQMRRWLEEHGLGARAEEGAEGAAYVTVQTERLDRLLNIAGELTVTSTRLQFEDRSGGSSGETLRALAGLVRSLQEEVMRTRLLPARTLFAGLPRLVRDASKARGLEVDLVLEEGGIGLDRGMVDRLGGVLAHLVQNSVAHGIEAPAQRVAAGKPARGRVQVRLRREQETVALEVEDDGRGLAEESIRARAVERGLWSEARAAQAGASEVADVLFAPGFSTSETADDHAGRGIGLTAVRETVRELGGSVRLRSEAGAGTLIHIDLPPTIALLDTLVADAGGVTVALPLRNVVRVHAAREAVRVAGRRMLLDADEAVPLLDLRGAPCQGEEGRFAVVLQATRGRFALVVDALLGTHSTILKPLDPLILDAHERAMGAAVLGSGTLAIVVDPNRYQQET